MAVGVCATGARRRNFVQAVVGVQCRGGIGGTAIHGQAVAHDHVAYFQFVFYSLQALQQELLSSLGGPFANDIFARHKDYGTLSLDRPKETQGEVEREFREVRLPLATEYGKQNDLNRITINPVDPWLGIVATGFTYHQTLEALRRLGLATEADVERAGIRLLQLRMPVPFDTDLVRRFAEGLDEILVVAMPGLV